MAIVLGPNRYGKAETRLVRVTRDGETHTLTDLNVSIALAGDLAATHLTGDNTGVLPTDTMKNTVYAFAKQHGVGEPEEFALLLARHFLKTQGQVTTTKIKIESYGWDRLGPHSFRREGAQTRIAQVVATAGDEQVVSGVTGLTLLNTTASEFHGFIKDRYTTLPETRDRILATAVDARWRHLAPTGDWAAWFEGLTIILGDKGETILTGPVVDQAALHGVLIKIRDLGLPLLALTRLDPGTADAYTGLVDASRQREWRP